MENDKAAALPLITIDDVSILDGLVRFASDERPPRAPANRRLLLRGWAVSLDSQECWHSLCVEIDSLPFDARARREKRHDVAEHFAALPLSNSGFTIMIDLAGLAVGKHVLKILADGIPGDFEYTFEVEPSRPSVLSKGRDRGIKFEIVEFHPRFGETTRPFRLQSGLAAVARGWIVDLADGAKPQAVYIVVDGIDAYEGMVGVPLPGGQPPVESSASTPFLACLRTVNLEIGEHIAEIAIVSSDGKTQVWSEPVAFIVDPLHFDESHVISPTNTLASISWLDEPADIRKRVAMRRAFSRGEIAMVRGWAFECEIRSAAHQIFVIFENGDQFALAGNGTREDVARHYGMPNAVHCGFAGGIATDTLSRGSNVGRCYVASIDGRTVYPSEATIEIEVVD
jgi:hypothetical protein